MAYLTHLCKRCGHSREAHMPHTESCIGYTRCRCATPEYETRPVVREETHWRTGLALPLVTPGNLIYRFPNVRACACDECRVEYAVLVDNYPEEGDRFAS